MKEVVITGASSGIGQAISQEFSAQGWKTHLLARNIDKLKSVQKTLPNESEIYSVDLSDVKSIENVVRELEERKANISAIVNNAGIFKATRFDLEPQDSWTWHFATNLFGPVQLTRLLWPHLLKNKGSITNISSTLGLRPIAHTGAYSASKAAMDNWTQTLALEGGSHGIRANCISPGLVDTPIHAFHKSDNPAHKDQLKMLQTLQPLGRTGLPQDIAHAVYFLASEKASWMTGAIVPVDGGVTVTTNDPFSK